MNATSMVLRELTAAGLELALDADGASVLFAPAEAVSRPMLDRIVACKPALIALIQRASGRDPIGAAVLERFAAAHPELVDPEMASWSDDARYVYDERIGVAIDQGMDVSPGSEAEQIARREARRVQARIPATGSTTRDSDIFDAALEAFAPLGGLTYLHSEPRKPEGEDAANQQIKDPIE